MTDVFSKLNPLAIMIIMGIVTILVLSVILSSLIRRSYRKLGQAVTEVREGSMDVEAHPFLDEMVHAYKKVAERKPQEVNTQAIIENHFNRHFKRHYFGERFIKQAISLMIILGLLGTFYGLTLSIGKLVNLLSNSANTEVLASMDSIVGGLIDSVKGMSVAFATSLFGIAASIIMTVLNVIFNLEEVRTTIMVEIEAYLDNHVALEVNAKPNGSDAIVLAFERTLNSFAEKIEANLRTTLNASSRDLVAATREVEHASGSFAKTMQHFDVSLKRFAENTRDFSEFNHNFRTNIERLNVTFADFNEDLQDHIKKVATETSSQNK